MKKLTILVLVFLGCMFLSGASLAWADGIDFAGGMGGKLLFSPGKGHPFNIRGAPISCVSNMGTGECAPDEGKYELVSIGQLSFTTGAQTSAETTTPPYTWDFGSGGKLTITGGVPSLDIPSGSTLLTGTFTNGFLTWDAPSSPILGTFTGGLTDVTGNATLLKALGAGVTTGSGASTVYLQMRRTGRDTLQGRVTSSSTTGTTVAEPASLALMGAGLLGIAFGVRRRQASQSGSKG